MDDRAGRRGRPAVIGRQPGLQHALGIAEPAVGHDAGSSRAPPAGRYRDRPPRPRVNRRGNRSPAHGPAGIPPSPAAGRIERFVEVGPFLSSREGMNRMVKAMPTMRGWSTRSGQTSCRYMLRDRAGAARRSRSMCRPCQRLAQCSAVVQSLSCPLSISLQSPWATAVAAHRPPWRHRCVADGSSDRFPASAVELAHHAVGQLVVAVEAAAQASAPGLPPRRWRAVRRRDSR